MSTVTINGRASEWIEQDSAGQVVVGLVVVVASWGAQAIASRATC